MRWREVISCWVSRTWSCADAESYTSWAKALRDWAGRNDWAEKPSGSHEVRFRRGARLLFTFDYAGGRGEVQARLRFDPYRERMTLSVGNTGFPFEAMLSRPKYERVLEQVDQELCISQRAESPEARIARMERLTRPLALLVRDRPGDREAGNRIRQIITDFASATPDNLSCATRLRLVQGPDYIGLGTRNGTLLSDLINRAEDFAPPAELKSACPGLTDEDWAAALRLCTLILSDLECSAATDPVEALSSPADSR